MTDQQHQQLQKFWSIMTEAMETSSEMLDQLQNQTSSEMLDQLQNQALMMDQPGTEVCWVPEDSLAGFFGHRDVALELVCGAGFWGVLMCGAGPGDLSRGAPGVGFGRKPNENRPQNLQPDCLQVPRSIYEETTGHNLHCRLGPLARWLSWRPARSPVLPLG